MCKASLIRIGVEDGLSRRREAHFVDTFFFLLPSTTSNIISRFCRYHHLISYQAMFFCYVHAPSLQRSVHLLSHSDAVSIRVSFLVILFRDHPSVDDRHKVTTQEISDGPSGNTISSRLGPVHAWVAVREVGRS